MSWVEVFLVFVVCHAIGDFMLQTDWQAIHKSGGLGRDAVARRALGSHLFTYAIAFVPALIWVEASTSPLDVVLLLALVIVPHALQDDRRLLDLYARRVKGADPSAEPMLMLMLDQAFHAVTLFGIALLVSQL